MDAPIALALAVVDWETIIKAVCGLRLRSVVGRENKYQSINQSIDRPINQSINHQSINQSINQSIIQCCAPPLRLCLQGVLLGDINSVYHHWQLFRDHPFTPPIPLLPFT